ncbi:MAG TPA: DUF2568 domain-containing protein, partial [Demequina sp.]|nr:DUF2568 domain-containing protein [Demequina sp.]
MKAFGAALVFLAELGMYAAFAVLGLSLATGVRGVVLGVALPVAVAGFWGVFLSPRAPRPLPRALKVMVQLLLLLMLGGAVAAWTAGIWWLAILVTL